MRKGLISAAILTACMILTVLAAGCSRKEAGPGEKTFSNEGVTITLTDEFSEKMIGGKVAYYESETVKVTQMQETFTALEEAGIPTDITLQRYVQAVINKNKLKDSKLRLEGELVYYTREETLYNRDYKYMTVVYKSADGFWSITFGVRKEKYDGCRDDFLKWASSVTIE